jgi:hypothetical protein
MDSEWSGQACRQLNDAGFRVIPAQIPSEPRDGGRLAWFAANEQTYNLSGGGTLKPAQ